MAYQRNGYYYRSRREAGRVVTDYLGSGVFGQFAAELDEAERAERREERRRCQQQVELDGRADKNVRVVTDALSSLAHAVLLCSGHHTHKGQWRKRRE